ncbi:MAG: hypothetical protein ACRCU5_03320, partial [Rhizobiaceae bacterium]
RHHCNRHRLLRLHDAGADGPVLFQWFVTLRRLPPTSASTGMLLVPVIGVVSAALILGEPLPCAKLLRQWC